ncbi:hypothetical protein D9B42_12300, partial [Corynebacterium diphtheriae]
MSGFSFGSYPWFRFLLRFLHWPLGWRALDVDLVFIFGAGVWFFFWVLPMVSFPFTLFALAI